MSHFTTVQTKIKNVMRLVQTLKELNFKFTQAKAHQQVHVKGYLGQTQEADICIHASDKYEIGIKINAETGTAEFFADEDFLEMHAGYNLNDFRRLPHGQRRGGQARLHAGRREGRRGKPHPRHRLQLGGLDGHP